MSRLLTTSPAQVTTLSEPNPMTEHLNFFRDTNNVFSGCSIDCWFVTEFLPLAEKTRLYRVTYLWATVHSLTKAMGGLEPYLYPTQTRTCTLKQPNCHGECMLVRVDRWLWQWRSSAGLKSCNTFLKFVFYLLRLSWVLLATWRLNSSQVTDIQRTNGSAPVWGRGGAVPGADTLIGCT